MSGLAWAYFSQREKGSGLWAVLLQQRFAKGTAGLGFSQRQLEPELVLLRPAAAR